MQKSIGSLLAGFFLLGSGYARHLKMMRVDAESSGRQVSLAVGDKLELSLAENPTAGFRWHLASKADPACSLVKSWFEAAPGVPGRGGIHHWEFQAVRAGAARIELEYRRAWEKDSPAGKSFKLSIRVLRPEGRADPKSSE